MIAEPAFISKAREKYGKTDNSSIFKYGLGITSRFEAKESKAKGFLEVEINGKRITAEETWKNPEFAKHFLGSIETRNNLMAANLKFLNSIAFIKIPQGKDAGTVHVKIQGTDSYSYILVIAEKESRGTIVEETIGENCYRSSIIEIIADENSNIKYASVQKAKNGQNYSYRKATLQKNAQIEWLDIQTGSTVKTETETELFGEGSSCNSYTVFFGAGNEAFDLYTKANHIGKNTHSRMNTSGALSGSAKAIQESFAKINKTAYGASAHQKSKILLLSREAKASPIPKLEIDNNDVAATHQASVGRIDAEKIFYMMSRGLSEKQAKQAYVEGFFEQYTSTIDVMEIKEDVRKIIEEKMENEH